MTSLAMYVDDSADTFGADTLPADAAMVMSALEAGGHCQHDRRVARRTPYQTVTELRLFRDEPSLPGIEIFTRDVNRRGLGFITRHRLPLGYGGVVQLEDEHQVIAGIHCTLLRCREASPGWYEGSLCFNREQPQFDR